MTMPTLPPTPEPVSRYAPAPSPQHASPRSLENLFLNICLYIGSLLVIAAASLLVHSVATAPLQILLLLVLTALLCAAGLATYQWVPKLRLASYSFTATSLALIPLCGVAIYRLVWPYSGSLLWLLVSLIGTLTVVGALALMPVRIMSYLALAYLVSDVLAVSKTLQVGLIWYFVSLIVLTTLFTLLLRSFASDKTSRAVSGLMEGSRVFVPATVLAAVMIPALEHWEVAIIAALATAHACAFLNQLPTWFYYLQARIYSLLAVLMLSPWLAESPLTRAYVLLPAALVLLSTSLALLAVRLPQLPWRTDLDSAITAALAQPFLAYTFYAVTRAEGLSVAFFDRSALVGSETQITDLAAPAALIPLALLNCAVLANFAHRFKSAHLIPSVSLALCALSFFVLPSLPSAALALSLGLLCLWLQRAQTGVTCISPSQVRWAQALTLIGTGTTVLGLGLVPGSPRYLALVLLGAGMAASHLIAELSLRKTHSQPAQLPQVSISQSIIMGALYLSALLIMLVFSALKDSAMFGDAGASNPSTWALALGLGLLLALTLSAGLLTLERATAPQSELQRNNAVPLHPRIAPGSSPPTNCRTSCARPRPLPSGRPIYRLELLTPGFYSRTPGLCTGHCSPTATHRSGRAQGAGAHSGALPYLLGHRCPAHPH